MVSYQKLKEYGIPKRDKYVFYDGCIYNPPMKCIDVLDIDITEEFEYKTSNGKTNRFATIKMCLSDGREINIHSAYFKDMQYSGFEDRLKHKNKTYMQAKDFV